ncbi:hypothetical protein X975_05681, partial [Stegodyphus mimosarum]
MRNIKYPVYRMMQNDKLIFIPRPLISSSLTAKNNFHTIYRYRNADFFLFYRL